MAPKRKGTRDLLGRFRASPAGVSSPGPVDLSNVRNADTVSVDNRVGQGAPFANRSPQLDPMAVRVAARSFVNRMPNPEGESPEARERRVDRVAERWSDSASGDSIQSALRMPVDEIQARAAEQGRPGGNPRPGDPPFLYK